MVSGKSYFLENSLNFPGRPIFIQLPPDAYFECYVKEYIVTIYHPVGTCAMGPKGKKNSVLDHRLRDQLYKDRSSRKIDSWRLQGDTSR